MKMYLFSMEIIEENNSLYTIKISSSNQFSLLTFDLETRVLTFLNNNKLSCYLKENEYQLRKLLHNKRPKSYYKGFKLNFSLRDNKDVAVFNDRTKIVVLDKRGGKYNSYVIDKGIEKIYKVYTDASFLQKKESSAYAILVEDLKGNYKLISEKVDIKNSNLVELYAAIKAFEYLKDIEKIRIITDSQYVRKGLTEWVFNWKLNDWHTANGDKVKNVEYWNKFDNVTDNKYIEFQYVKGHSQQFGNTICDLYAKETANK